MLSRTNCYWAADQQLRRFRLGIHVQDADLGRTLTGIGNQLFPLQILVELEDGLGHVCLCPVSGLLWPGRRPANRKTEDPDSRYIKHGLHNIDPYRTKAI